MANITHMTEFANASDFALDEFIEFQEAKKTLPLWFPLVASSIGKKKLWRILVKRITTADKATFDQLPKHLQTRVWDRISAMNKELQSLQEQGENSKDILEALSRNESYVKTGEMFLHAGSVDPKIVLNAHEENIAERKLYVGRIEAEDKIAFLIACQDADSEYAKQFELFRPEPVVDASDRDDGPVVEDATERPAGVAGGGIPE